MKIRSLFAALITALFIGAASAQAEVDVVKTHLLDRLVVLQEGVTALQEAAESYYQEAEAIGFDYEALAQTRAEAVRATLQAARDGWRLASPSYESIEGIVAGVPVLSQFDVDMDAGTSLAEGSESAVSFDLTLADGSVLEKPGNLFGVTESTLWGTFDAFSSGVAFDVGGDGSIGFGDKLPDASVLKAAADKLAEMSGALVASSEAWQPTSEDVFGALAGNVPTVAEVFLSRWKASRFVLGEATEMRDFGVISSLRDLGENINSWQALYRGVSAQVAATNPALDEQIVSGLAALEDWVTGLIARESEHRFTPEQAELIFDEGDRRASDITGRIVQAAALLDITVE